MFCFKEILGAPPETHQKYTVCLPKAQQLTTPLPLPSPNRILGTIPFLWYTWILSGKTKSTPSQVPKLKSEGYNATINVCEKFAQWEHALILLDMLFASSLKLGCLKIPETKSSHLKIGFPKRKVIFQPSIFRCENVSFRVFKKHWFISSICFVFFQIVSCDKINTNWKSTLVVSNIFWTPIWGNDVIWQILFRWVETTNCFSCSHHLKQINLFYMAKDFTILTSLKIREANFRQLPSRLSKGTPPMPPPKK